MLDETLMVGDPQLSRLGLNTGFERKFYVTSDIMVGSIGHRVSGAYIHVYIYRLHTQCREKKQAHPRVLLPS